MIEHTPLDTSLLSAAAQKALGAGPARMMASRGLVPLPPSDQITVLYQLSIDADQNLGNTARTTAMGLPDKLLAGALADPGVDARVLDLFARLVGDKAIAFEALVGNTGIADATVVYLAENGGTREIERIATDETRLLRHPEIIAAMYQNKLARMSTVDRTIELAVRNNIRVPGLAAWDEIARALQGAPATTPEADALFARAAAASAAKPDTEALAAAEPEGAAEVDETSRDKLSVPGQIRLATLGNAEDRGVFIRSPLRIVAVAAIKSPGVSEFEAERYAGNANLPDDVIRYIASKREWTKNPQIRDKLCRNPKTPVPEAMRLVPGLNGRQLAALAQSRGVPSPVVALAKKLMMERRGVK